MNQYRQEQQAFVTGHSGSHWLTILAILGQVPLLIALLKFIHAGAVIQILVLAVYPVLMVTVLAEYCIILLAALLMVLVVSIATDRLFFKRHGPVVDKKRETSINVADEGKEEATGQVHGINFPFLTHFRGATLLMTVLAILAVDFTSFPRFLAKTETMGISLMDMGTGLFIFSSGLTSRYARHGRVAVVGEGRGVMTVLQRWIVLLLGVGRLVALKILSYQEHVSEYGVHWNFFVTIFFVWTLAEMLRIYLGFGDATLLVITALQLTAYQCYLLQPGSLLFIFNGERDSFFAANREGILSLNSYLPMYIISEVFSRHFIFGGRGSTEQESVRSKSGTRQPLHIALFGLAFLSSLLFLVIDMSVQPISRRLTNSAFVAFVTAVSSFLLAVLLLVDNIGDLRPLSCFSALSGKQLVIFLLANLLTGAVNFSLQTLYVGKAMSIIILCVYIFLLLASSYALIRYQHIAT